MEVLQKVFSEAVRYVQLVQSLVRKCDYTINEVLHDVNVGIGIYDIHSLFTHFLVQSLTLLVFLLGLPYAFYRDGKLH